MPINKLVIGLAGMPGSGKSIVVEAAVERGYDVVVMGNAVRREAKRRDLEPTPENIGKIMLHLREAEGNEVMAKRCIPEIENSEEQRVIVDGVRSLFEADEFRKHFPKFTLVAVHSSPETRFKRLRRRRRSDDPSNWEIFRDRDLRELSVGLGNAIAMAEHIILNEEDFQAAKRKAQAILARVETKWKK